MTTLSYVLFAALFFALGWGGHAYQERRKRPRKRSRAIPAGTKAEKRPRAPRKDAAVPPPSGPELPMGDA